MSNHVTTFGRKQLEPPRGKSQANMVTCVVGFLDPSSIVGRGTWCSAAHCVMSGTPFFPMTDDCIHGLQTAREPRHRHETSGAQPRKQNKVLSALNKIVYKSHRRLVLIPEGGQNSRSLPFCPK